MIEGTQTVCVLVGREPMARSSAGLTVQLGQVGQGQGRQGRQAGRSQGRSGQSACGHASRGSTYPSARRQRKNALGRGAPAPVDKKLTRVRFSDRLFKGLNTEARVIRARARGFDDVRVCVSTAAC